MLSVEIICVGKLKESYLRDAAAEYSKRMGPMCRLTVTELAEERIGDDPSPAEIRRVIEAESARISARLSGGDYVVTMCVEGSQLSSEELSARLERVQLAHSSVVFVIGGSWGLSDSLKARSDLRLSMGRMTFPHQLCRVMLLEQIYRAFQISRGSKYHK